MVKMLLIFLTACVAWAAEVTGTWNLLAEGADGQEYKLELVLESQNGNLSGTISSEQGSLALEDVKLTGNELTYKVPYQGGYVFKLTAEANNMKGTFTSPDGATGKVTATKK